MKFEKTTMIGAILLGGLAMASAQGIDMAAESSRPLPPFLKIFDKDGDDSISGDEAHAIIDGVKRVADFFKDRIDTDGDGTISAVERGAVKEMFFERFDEESSKRFEETDGNGDGNLGFDEFSENSAVKILADFDPDKPAEIFGRLDADGDGLVSVTERQSLIDDVRSGNSKLVALVDSDSDGTISDEERAAAKETFRERADAESARRFEEADSDGDGFLDFEEFGGITALKAIAEFDPDKPMELFGRLDADGNERVSLEELRGAVGK